MSSLLLLFMFIVFTLTSKVEVEVEAKIPAIIVFGDSSVDSGNNNVIKTLLKSNFRPYGRDFLAGQPTGRFSNGKVPPDFISQAFGLKPTIPAYLDPAFTIADFATGVCFASAGTGFDNATSDVLNVIPLWKEVELFKEYQRKLRGYLGNEKANEVIKESLYLVSLGTNDFLENYYTIPRRRLQFTIQEFEDFLLELARNFIKEIYSLGVRKISFTGLPPMGCLPLERATNVMANFDCVDKYNLVALEFNNKLEAFVWDLNTQLPALTMLFANPYPIFYQIITNPYLFGYEVAGKACCGTGTFEMSYLCNQENSFTCPDASKYVFWDAFHPTEKTNQIIVNHLLPSLLSTFN
ncbi:unnamed protein product [Citrullus colocynthis]|uniref:GDSL esterase/lipase n=1 Tax=Citrullus colocynthis TaxID=252529 RepID=A0ABP0XPS4_9ROSI